MWNRDELTNSYYTVTLRQLNDLLIERLMATSLPIEHVNAGTKCDTKRYIELPAKVCDSVTVTFGHYRKLGDNYRAGTFVHGRSQLVITCVRFHVWYG